MVHSSETSEIGRGGNPQEPGSAFAAVDDTMGGVGVQAEAFAGVHLEAFCAYFQRHCTREDIAELFPFMGRHILGLTLFAKFHQEPYNAQVA